MSALHRSTCSSICCLQWCLCVHTAASHACADEAGRRRRTFLARCDWQPAAESQRGKIVRLAGSSRASLSPSPSSLDRCGAQVEAGSDRCRLALEHAWIDRLGKTRGEESTNAKRSLLHVRRRTERNRRMEADRRGFQGLARWSSRSGDESLKELSFLKGHCVVLWKKFK